MRIDVTKEWLAEKLAATPDEPAAGFRQPIITLTINKDGTVSQGVRQVKYQPLRRRTNDQDMPTASGFLFVADDLECRYPRVLLIKRSGYCHNHPGTWAFPGGGIEHTESSLLAATRECMEEIGFDPRVFNRSYSCTESLGVADGFETFLMCVNREFDCQLNQEHDAYTWARMDALPQPMHPNALAVINELKMRY